MKWKPLLFIALIWGGLFILVEAGSWMVLKLAITRHPSENPLVNEYVARGYPLFVDNDDLRIRDQEFFFHPYLRYTQVPGHVTVRPHGSYVSHIMTDSAGFIHTGDPQRNPAALAKPKGKSYRVIFIGGSTTFGLGASRNETTIPALFEQELRKVWPDVDFLVLNAGVQGYPSTQERLLYELYLSDLDPDLVVALDGVNDAKFTADLPQWRPYFSPAAAIDEPQFVGIHRPYVQLANMAKSLISFPEPLASLALLRRGLSRLELATVTQARHDPPGSYDPRAAIQLRDNLTAEAIDLAAHKRLGLFVLQPYLGAGKDNLTKDEVEILDDYRNRLDKYNHHYADFKPIYDDLGKRFANRPIRFVDLRSLFSDIKSDIYVSLAHYNDMGNKVLADTMFGAIRSDLGADLSAKGLLP